MLRNRLQPFLAVAMLAHAMPALAQNYPFPGSKGSAPVVCTGCRGNNTQGQPNDGKPTYPYDAPLLAHVGRLVDSSTTQNYQNIGIRTVRAGKVRAVPSRNRIYVQLGEAVGVYALDTFFTGTLAAPLQLVNNIETGISYNMRPLEKVHVPDGFFYAESPYSGWSTSLIDAQKELWDFDADDRGYVYVSTLYFGWGIARENQNRLGQHLPFVAQMPNGSGAETIFALRSGTAYYAAASSLDYQTLSLFDVTIPASPVAAATRGGKRHAVQEWAKNDKDERLAVLNLDGIVRVYTYAGFVAGDAPLAALTPQTGRAFATLTFDDAGNVWVADRAADASTYDTGTLWKLTVSGNGYTTSATPIDGGAFRASILNVGSGYLAVGGGDQVGAYDLRLFRLGAGGLELLNTDGFFKKYYSVSPAGYAIPDWRYITPVAVKLVTQGANTYVLYNAWGLGDGYRITTAASSITSIAPASGPPSGGTTVILDTINVTGSATVTFDGVAGTGTSVESGRVVTTAPAHAPGPVNVQVVTGGVTLAAPQQFTYILAAPAHFGAVATSPTSIALTWDAVEGATEYELARRNVDGSWTSLGKTPNRTLNDAALLTGAAYEYRVRALDGSGYASSYALDAATTVPLATTSVTLGTIIRRAHVIDLQNAVNSFRVAAGLSAMTFTTTNNVRAADIVALRTGLAEARTILGLSTPFTDASLAGTTVKAVHVQELLEAVR